MYFLQYLDRLALLLCPSCWSAAAHHAARQSVCVAELGKPQFVQNAEQCNTVLPMMAQDFAWTLAIDRNLHDQENIYLDD